MKRIYLYISVAFAILLAPACNNRNEKDSKPRNNESELGTQIDEQSKGQVDHTMRGRAIPVDSIGSEGKGAVDSAQGTEPKAAKKEAN